MLVAGGELDGRTVEEQLTQAALGIGLHPAEIARTIARGLRKGEQLPRVAPHRLEGIERFLIYCIRDVVATTRVPEARYATNVSGRL